MRNVDLMIKNYLQLAAMIAIFFQGILFKLLDLFIIPPKQLIS